MTSRRASRRKGHRPRRPRRHEHDDWATLLCWCADDAVEEAMRQSHDHLIALMGPMRTGGVSWQVSESIEHAKQICTLYVEGLGETIDDATSNHVRQVRAKLREFGGHVVLTMAPGRPVAAGHAADQHSLTLEEAGEILRGETRDG